MSEKCPFCQIVAGEIPSEAVFQDEHVYAFRDIKPLASSHVLVVPRRHIASLDEVQDSDADLLGHLLIASKKVAELENLSKGYRVVTNTGPDSGQEVFHLHFHVIGGRKLGPMG